MLTIAAPSRMLTCTVGDKQRLFTELASSKQCNRSDFFPVLNLPICDGDGGED